MARVYSQLLGHVNRSGTTDVVLYEASPELVTIIRDMTWIVTDEALAVIIIYYVSGSNTYTIVRDEMNAFDIGHWVGRQVLPPDAVLHAYGMGNDWTVLVSGYELLP